MVKFDEETPQTLTLSLKALLKMNHHFRTVIYRVNCEGSEYGQYVKVKIELYTWKLMKKAPFCPSNLSF